MLQMQIKLVPEKELFNSPKNDYKIYSCKTDDESVKKNKYGRITINGNMQTLELHQTYLATVSEQEHKKYGINY